MQIYGAEEKYVKRSVVPEPVKNCPFIKNITEVKTENIIAENNVICYLPFFVFL